MRLTTLVAALFPVAAIAQPSPSDTRAPLHVLRHTPSDTATTGNAITIIFDRPVAGRIEEMIDPRGIFHITPATAGRLEWRDPITLRFTPNGALRPGDRLTVTIDTTFSAMDGSRLEAPYRFTFRVPSARLIGRSFDAQGHGSLPWNGRVFLLYSDSVDSAFLSRAVRLELPACGRAAQQAVPYHALEQRALRSSDPYVLSYARDERGDTTAYGFQRVVVFEPTRALPSNCSGLLVIANTEEDSTHGRSESFGIRTADVFRLRSFDCRLMEVPPAQSCTQPSVVLSFSEGVRRDSLLKYVHLEPSIPLDPAKLPEQAGEWRLAAPLTPRTTYRVSIDPRLRDIHGRQIDVGGTTTLVIGDFKPAYTHAVGVVTMAAAGKSAMPVQHVNVRTLRVIARAIRPADRIATLWRGTLVSVAGAPRAAAETSLVTLAGDRNEIRTTDVMLPPHSVALGTLVEVRMEIADTIASPASARAGVQLEMPVRYNLNSADRTALVQRTDLTADLHMGSSGGIVHVVRGSDGRGVPDALVRLRDPQGATVAEARTNDSGFARLTTRPPEDSSSFAASRPIFGMLELVRDSDAVITPLLRRALGYRPVNPLDLSGLGARFEAPSAVRATLHADRDIYRPGEMIYLRGIVRRGALGTLALPAAGDSVRLTVRYRPNDWYDSEESAPIRDTVIALSTFGTMVDSFATRRGTQLGTYVAELQRSNHGVFDRTEPPAQVELRIAEYRPPEFLVDVATDSEPRYAGDTIHVRASSHYLFGAPMRHAQIQWRAVLRDAPSEGIRVPGAEGWSLGGWRWWREDGARRPARELSGSDSLDEQGRVDIAIPVSSLGPDQAGSVAIDVAVTDVNRQVVSAGARVQVHPSRVFVLAREQGRQWLWRVGERVAIDTRVIRADGSDVVGVPVRATVMRLRWTSVSTPHWQEDTVAVDTIRSALTPTQFSYVPPLGAMYVISFSASDGRGGTARTDVSGYATGSEWRMPADNPYRLPLIADKREQQVGDTTRVAFESPFDSATAWITIERERVLEQRTLRVARGSNVVPVVIEARHVPNVFVSVLLRPLGPPQRQRPDSARELLRVGYVELDVATSSRRLRVTVTPKRAECAPGDSAEFTVQVRDHAGHGARSQVALWAVDEGVLALTGFTTPDLISRMYEPRGVGSYLWSTVPHTITADPRLSAMFLEQEAMMLESAVLGAAVAGYSGPSAGMPRATFRSTAFYLGAITTNAQGIAEARARMPDNLTTFRVMAVAVGSDDRFGSGDTTVLVTRALIARPSLPRFVRPSDSLYAGAAITARDGKERTVTVTALDSTPSHPTAGRRDVKLQVGSEEARFSFVVPPRDSARDSMRVIFTATDGANSDAVRSAIPVQPDFHVRAHTAFGLLRGKGDVSITLPGDIDASKSRVVVRVGTTPLAPMLAAYRWLDSYPYDCTEQISSIGRALIAVWRASDHGSLVKVSDPQTRLQNFADELARRQRPDGGIAYWRDHRWTSPWLSAYAGQFLLDARAIGIVVDSGVVRRLGDYLHESLGEHADTGGMNRFERQERRLQLGERVSSIGLLRRIGRPEIEAEDELLAIAAQMTWEDRLRLAEALSSRADVHEDVVALVEAAWNATERAGNRVDVPDSAHSERAFPSHVAPAASLLSASLRLHPDHPLLGGLIETVLQQGRAARGWAWSTQDYASVVMALAALPRSSGRRTLSVSVAGRVVLSRNVAESDSVAVDSLNGMLVGTSDGTSLRVHLDVRDRGAMYYAVIVHEVPSKAPTTPDIRGIVVERWYERFDDGRPVTQLKEGDLVRVRLRLTVPADRQFVALEDPLPAGLEPVDLSLRTSSTLAPFVTPRSEAAREDGDRDRDGPNWQSWLYGSWDDGWWSPWEHKEMHDDRVVYFARMLWRGSYTASYVARATTSGSFVRPPAYAEEMYNPALQGRSDGGRFEVTRLP